MRKRKKNRKGFTLVELLIVVVIIGILAAIALPRFNITKSESELRICQSNLMALNTSIDEHNYMSSIKIDATTFEANILNNTNRFPDGPPLCPTNNGAYTVTDMGGGVFRAVCPEGHTL